MGCGIGVVCWCACVVCVPGWGAVVGGWGVGGRSRGASSGGRPARCAMAPPLPSVLGGIWAGASQRRWQSRCAAAERYRRQGCWHTRLQHRMLTWSRAGSWPGWCLPPQRCQGRQSRLDNSWTGRCRSRRCLPRCSSGGRHSARQWVWCGTWRGVHGMGGAAACGAALGDRPRAQRAEHSQKRVAAVNASRRAAAGQPALSGLTRRRRRRRR